MVQGGIMKRALLWSCILFLTVASGAWGSTALPGLPLPGYHGFSINVANEATTFYIDFASAGLGLNAEWVGPVGATSRTGLTSINTTSPSYSGSLAAYDTGGAGSGVTDFILLVSVQGSIASNFGVNLAWGTYNQTFTSSSFIYGPQTTKPGSSATALYPGQSSSTGSLLMFVDLKGGLPGLGNAVPVTYSFTGLYGDTVAFNMYGYSPTGGNVDKGVAGIDWTNNTATNGYVIYDTAVAPVPVPPSLLLLAGGLGGLGMLRRNRTRKG